MSAPVPIPKSKSESRLPGSDGSVTSESGPTPPSGLKTPGLFTSTPGSPLLSPFSGRNSYFSSSTPGSYQEDWEFFPPMDRLTVLDILDNLALPQRLEKLQQKLSAQTEKVRRQQEKLKSTGLNAKDRVVEEWRRRVPPPDEQLEKYRRKMRESVERLGRRWSDTKAVTTREKAAFIAGVLNIFISGYLIGAYPQFMHVWYTLQLCYFMPIRAYTYHQRGYHYFLADLCYFVNVLTLLSIWLFPRSKRLLMSTYCLAYGNNAVAIAMWRNSMVFHSLDKVTSLFIHIMPPVTLHCIIHLIPPKLQQARFPAVWAVKENLRADATRYSLWWMLIWATMPYAVWQLSYHMLITVRRRDKIAAGRPTSFTWLRRSYSKQWIGRAVLSLPDALQEPAFMLIQYTYAVVTMLPCPVWFRYRWLSAAFLLVVFTWSVYNGATYYIDVFGKRFQNELEQLRKEVAREAASAGAVPPPLPPQSQHQQQQQQQQQQERRQSVSPDLAARLMEAKMDSEEDATTPVLGADGAGALRRHSSIDQIPLLDGRDAVASGSDTSSAVLLRGSVSNDEQDS